MSAPRRGEDPKALLQSYMDDLLSVPDAPPEPVYADPRDEQRERLQKLLYSATPARHQTSAPGAVVVEPRVEPVAREPFRPKAPEPVARPAVAVPDPVPQPSAPKPSVTEQEADEDEVPDLSSAPAPRHMKDVEWLDNGRPTWAQERFDVLLFKVSGLTLAVPLIALGQIQPLTDELTPLFGQADWFMGLLPTPTGKVRTVNTAKFVMPERYDEQFVKTAQYVISIDGVPWGLAVDSVNQPITLDPDDVKWRTERSRRPWLAGTVKEHMCALLDIPKVGQLLMEADRKRA